MAQEKKIHVGLVGLNAPYTGAPTGTNWTASAHLPYLLASSKYEIVALQNSSVDRAKAAIKAYNLDEQKVKAYGTAEDLAKDTDVDFVVTSIRVDKHAGSQIPAIMAGKDVYVEWPMEANITKVKELAGLAKAHKVRNIVGMQGSFEPVARKVKALIDAGVIGDVESSTYIGKLPGGASMPEFVSYFADKKIGGNYFTIGFGHVMELIRLVLGNISTYRSRLVNQHPTVSLTNPITQSVIETRTNDVPTQIVLDAVMTSGAILTFKFHSSATVSPGAKPAKEPAYPMLDWSILGSKGEIRITSPSWAITSGGAAGKTKVELVKADVGVVEEVKLEEEEDEWKDLPSPARNIARLYEAFATGRDGGKGDWYPDFEYAVKRHEMIEEMYKENGF